MEEETSEVCRPEGHVVGPTPAGVEPAASWAIGRGAVDDPHGAAREDARGPPLLGEGDHQDARPWQEGNILSKSILGCY